MTPAPETYTQDWGTKVQDALIGLGAWPEDPSWPPIPGPFDPDPCVLAQIEREPFNARGRPKDDFTILLMNKDTGEQWWHAPYKVALPGGFGWVSGDKAGYKSAYMFAVDREDGRVTHRVWFFTIPGAAYAKLNDEEMYEIQTTQLGFDGKCADPISQDQAPTPTAGYEPYDGPDQRPIIKLMLGTELVDDRSYTNTTILTPGAIKFQDGGLIEEPFEMANGFGDFHTVYQRQIVTAHSVVDGNAAAIGVYYDALDPAAWISRS